MSSATGFWSYVHADDEAEGGRIRRLALDIVSQYALLTGEEISLFVDKLALKWGDDWKSRIDDSLTGVAFFAPVMTPRYFLSPECRRELGFFARKAENLGVRELILPIHYVEVPELAQENSTDELIQLVRKFNWIDWRKLRFSNTPSGRYRDAVADMAQRLVTANREAEEVSRDRNIECSPVQDEVADSSPGLVDRLAGVEEALPLWTETMTHMTGEIEAIGELMKRSGEEVARGDAQGAGFAARLRAARSLARNLRPHSEKLALLSDEYIARLNTVDDGIRAIIEHAPEEARRDSESTAQFQSFFDSVRALAASSDETEHSLTTMLEGVQNLERLSRDVRPEARHLRQSLTKVIEAGKVISGWINLLDNSGISNPAGSED